MAIDPRMISIAIQRFVDHIRTHSDGFVCDIGHEPTEDERAHRKAAVQALCDAMQALAERAATSDVRFPEFEDLQHQLGKLGAYAPSDYVAAVATAFMLAGRLDRSHSLAVASL